MLRKEFAFDVFNKDVREYLQRNCEHPEYNDFWGVRRSFTVEARNREEAQEKIDQKYPQDKGFVVTLKS